MVEGRIGGVVWCGGDLESEVRVSSRRQAELVGEKEKTKVGISTL